MNFRMLLIFAFMLILVSAQSEGASPSPKEEDYYPVSQIPIPDGLVLEVGALELLPDQRLAVSTRRGDIYLITNPFSKSPEKELKFQRFAHGLHEVLGLAYRDGWLYATQRGEITRLKDSDGDGRADLFDTVADGWEINGDYHEYAFGSKFDRHGDIWVALCLTGSFESENPYRGWCLRIRPDGEVIPTCSGLRSPGGIGMNAEGDMFYTENQGPWNGACSLKHLKPGAFLGHPAGLRWHDSAKLGIPRPQDPTSGSRMAVEAKRIPELIPPAVYFPYPVMGQSASGIACDTTGGKFGPFANQLFVADQAASTVMRVVLEKVEGRYQGACIPFRQGFGSGCVPLLMTSQGSLFVGGTNRGWGSRGSKAFSLERLDWSGKLPFEIHDIHARPDGFEVRFTEALSPQTATDLKSYKISTYTYIYQSSYGSPEVDRTEPKIERVEVAPDAKSLRVFVNKLEEGHIHEIHFDGIRSSLGLPLLHAEAYYTMNTIPRPNQP